MNDASRVLERMADRSDGIDLPAPAVVRRAGGRRTRRTVALASATALAVLAAVVVGVGLRGPDQAHRPAQPSFVPFLPRPVAPLSPGLLTYIHGGNIEVGDGHGTPTVLAIKDFPCRGCWVDGLSWSPDGRSLALTLGSPSGAGPGMSRQRIFVVRRSSGSILRVVDCVGPGSTGFSDCGSDQGAFAWSPDSSSLAFTSGGHLFRARVSDPGSRPVDICPSCDTAALDWSPDGRTIAYLDGSGVAVVNATGGVPVPVARIVNATGVAWSPDGARLAADGDDGVHVIDLSGARPTTALVSPQGQGEGPGAPTWSPDGTRIALFSTPTVHGRFEAQLLTVRADGSQSRVLSDFGCCTDDWSPPKWSPDGTRIALPLALTPDGNLEVVLVDAATGAVVRREAGWGPVGWRRVSPSSR